jgi:putative FmdB family regulatory protein
MEELFGMPTYEYQCGTCNTVFDIFQSIKASPLRKAECPACEKERPVKRLISTGGAILFKGSGFYQTDYRSDKYKEAAKADNKTSPSADAAKDSASTSKPDSTPDKTTTPAAPEKTTKPKKKSSD